MFLRCSSIRTFLRTGRLAVLCFGMAVPVMLADSISPEEMAAQHRQLVALGSGALMPDEDEPYTEDCGIVPLPATGTFSTLFRAGLSPVFQYGYTVYPIAIRMDDETCDTVFYNATGIAFWTESAFLSASLLSCLPLSNPWLRPSHVVTEWLLVPDADLDGYIAAMEILGIFAKTNLADSVDTASEPSPQNSLSTLDDSRTFLGYPMAEFRGWATASGNLSGNPVQSPLDLTFMQSAGMELIQTTLDARTSPRRQIMNQADIFYFSGHGLHSSGMLRFGDNGCAASDLSGYWDRDLECVIIAGCSVLDINDYGGKFPGTDHLRSPGISWCSLGPRYFLGYNYMAPGDSSGAPAQIISSWISHKDSEGIVEAWMNANKEHGAWYACAIHPSGYTYFKKRWRYFEEKTVPESDW